MLNPKGGTFGGTCEKTELFAKYYDEMLDKSLQEGFLGTHPQSWSSSYLTLPTFIF